MIKIYISIAIQLLAGCYCFGQNAWPTVNDIAYDLNEDNQKTLLANCLNKQGMIISNAALNFFFADKVASYLAEDGDLSLFKNYATLSSADGTVSINHNWIKKSKESEFISSMVTAGVKVNALDGFASIFADSKFSSEMGINLKLTKFGRGYINFDGCTQQVRNEGEKASLGKQKYKMDVERAMVLHALIDEMRKKAADYESALNKFNSNDIRNIALSVEKDSLRAQFYRALKTEYMKKFAEKQSEKLEETNSYNYLNTWWASFSLFIPVTGKEYKVAESYVADFDDKKLYAFQAGLNYTRIFEGTYGKLFMTVAGTLTQNNSIATKEMAKMSVTDYKKLKETDTLKLGQLSSEDVYIGKYANFLTPQFAAKIVAFPGNWNVGLSASVEQNIGSYHALNGRLGIPIRLNDKEGKAKVNFEVQLRTTDMNDSANKGSTFWERSAIGLSVGLPFTSVL